MLRTCGSILLCWREKERNSGFMKIFAMDKRLPTLGRTLLSESIPTLTTLTLIKPE
jgi:hypothetical protein